MTSELIETYYAPDGSTADHLVVLPIGPEGAVAPGHRLSVLFIRGQDDDVLAECFHDAIRYADVALKGDEVEDVEIADEVDWTLVSLRHASVFVADWIATPEVGDRLADGRFRFSGLRHLDAGLVAARLRARIRSLRSLSGSDVLDQLATNLKS